MCHEMFFSEAGLRIGYLNKSSRSSFSYLTGATTHYGSVVAGNKYLSLYVLLAGIIGGILLVFSLFLFCKYCRGKSQHGTGVVGLGIEDSWAFGGTSVSIGRPEDVNSLRDQQDDEFKRESVVRNRNGALEVLNGQSHIGNLEQHLELENAFTPAAATTSKLIDDNVQTSIFLQKQKSIRSKESSPITSFSNINPETLECEVAVEIHSGPNQSLLDRNSNTNHCALHSTMGHHHNNAKGSWGKDESDDRTRGTPYRTQSIEWTKLESSLDFWRKEHSRHQLDDNTTSQMSKVRYNDTGSLEEVNVENLVDYYFEDELLVQIEEDHEHIKKQYRRLWQLRATLEEDEDKKRSNIKILDIQLPQSTHSPSQSPEREASHTTSFESNTEPLLDEAGKWPPHLLQLPSYEARRQTYRNILSWRLQKMEARNQRHHHGRQTSLDDNSFDSMDTVDTEESSDASRLDQATTSFESTTDNTDSTSESHMHRLQQLRADSGYRSLENPVPSLKMIYHQQYHVGSADFDSYEHQIPCLGESVEEGSGLEEITNPDDIYSKRYLSRKHVTLNLEKEDEVAELMPSTKALNDANNKCKIWNKQGSDSASKKRREFSCRPITGEEFLRDYSVDEKSDALFREFSKCESESSCRKHRLKTYRRLQAHHRDPLISEQRSVFSFNYADDETELASVPIIRIAPDDDSSDHL